MVEIASLPGETALSLLSFGGPGPFHLQWWGSCVEECPVAQGRATVFVPQPETEALALVLGRSVHGLP